MVDDPKPKGDENDNKDGMVSKEDYQKATERADKLEKNLEEVRMEVLSDDYMSFLDTKDKKVEEKPKDKDIIPDDKFEKMTKKEIFEAAKSAAVNEMTGTLASRQAAAKKAQDAETAADVKNFAKAHDDYDTFRPIMYGLSLDPKYKKASLDQLYTAAKDHVGRIHKEPSAEEKAKAAKSSSEKPGGSSTSFKKETSKSTAELTQDAVSEVEEALGPIPSA